MRLFRAGLILLLLLGLQAGVSVNVRPAFSADVVDEHLAILPDIGGPGYNMFFPQTFVVNEGDQVNITVRNLLNQSFSFTVTNGTSGTINPGNKLANESVTPVDTVMSLFTASTPGIFQFYSGSRADLVGYMVVLPTDWSTYNPQTASRSWTSLIIPDFAGDGYDKFFPNILVVNQNDSVAISFRSIDEHAHGIALPSYNISAAINGGTLQPNGTVTQYTTHIPTFTASIPGVFPFICTVYCGPGHIQMIGYLVVLPIGGSTLTPVSATDFEFLVVKHGFAGEGYDKFAPATLFVNQGDNVYIVVRSTDDMPHGFSLPTYNVNNVTITPANGTEPTDTYITTFTASQAGIFQYFCTIPCGPGHDQMTGQLVVLPRLAGQAAPTTTAATINPLLVVAAGLLLVVAGLVGGTVIALRSEPKKNDG